MAVTNRHTYFVAFFLANFLVTTAYFLVEDYFPSKKELLYHISLFNKSGRLVDCMEAVTVYKKYEDRPVSYKLLNHFYGDDIYGLTKKCLKLAGDSPELSSRISFWLAELSYERKDFQATNVYLRDSILLWDGAKDRVYQWCEDRGMKEICNL